MHLILGIALIVGLIAVHLVTAFRGPTLPTVKSSAPKGYVTTMDTDDNSKTDEMPAVTDRDPTDFSEDPEFQRMIEGAFDVAIRFNVTEEEVVRTLMAAVVEGDQR